MTSLSAVFGVQHEAWMEQARCKGANPNVFILDQGYTAAEAIKYCIKCTVREECKDYARRTGSVGIWGGMLFTQRYSEPVEYLPVQQIQDARPVPALATLRIYRVPGILGEAKRHPGILG